jgi:hypothetical protein|tara:strand:- start:369 stop:764 length:396 start_codon:yes stop_codon:yes gene_type:complete
MKLARNKQGHRLGINIRSDGVTDYAALIVSGQKLWESRRTRSLDPYVGKRVGIVRTGTGVATVTGSAVVGRAIAVNEKEFNDLRSEHLVPRGSTFDIEKGATKYLYPLVNCKQIKQRPVPKGSLGIIARQI